MKKSCDNLSAICLRWREGVTSTLPLQPKPLARTETSQQLMWDEARMQNAEHQLQQGKAKTSAGEQKKTLESSIEELESFIRQFEPKKNRT